MVFKTSSTLSSLAADGRRYTPIRETGKGVKRGKVSGTFLRVKYFFAWPRNVPSQKRFLTPFLSLGRYPGIYNFALFVFEFICVHLRSSAAGLLLQFSFVLIGAYRRPSAAKKAVSRDSSPTTPALRATPPPAGGDVVIRLFAFPLCPSCPSWFKMFFVFLRVLCVLRG